MDFQNWTVDVILAYTRVRSTLPYLLLCCFTAAERHSDNGVAVNSQPMNEVTNRQPYEELDLNAQTPVNYQQLSPRTGNEQGYYNVPSSAINTPNIGPYEQLDTNTQRRPVYAHLENR